MKKEKFNVLGMTCSSCSSHVEKAVSKVLGVKKVEVNLLASSMLVEYDDKITNNETIIKSVVNAGYNASVYNENKQEKSIDVNEDKINDNIKSMKKRFVVSVCFLIPLMFIAMYHMFFDLLNIPIPDILMTIFHGVNNAITFSFTQFLLLLPIIYVNRNYFIIGFKKLFRGTPNMDSLIALGSSAAIIYGIYAIYMIGIGLGSGNTLLVQNYIKDIYFESAGTILTLITLGKYLETKSKGKTNEAIKKLINLTPKTAILVRGDKEVEIEVKNIVVGDTILVKPGSSIPVDGVIVEGTSSIDQSAITGESIPVYKNIEDSVISGTINKTGYFKMRATKVGDDTTLAQIIKLVEEASNSKAPISKLADKVSLVFVPIVIVIAIITAIIWLVLGQSFEFALTSSIAVLVISCPCALGLATPVAIMVGTGKAAENGILIKSAESLEILHSIDTVVLDKTGTITEGKLKIDKIKSNILEEELLKIAGSLEKNSEHPLASAILEKVKEENIKLYNVNEFEIVPGRGVKGKINDKYYYGGNINFIKENNISVDNDMIFDIENTLLYFANEDKVIGVISVTDIIKDDSREAIDSLKRQNIDVYMITGDNTNVANKVADKVGIKNVISNVLPQDKEMEVKKLQNNGRKVAFVGDGINDSPALVKANVGIAIGSGTDIAIDSADVVLVKSTLKDVVNAISLSKSVIKNIKMNLFWAFFYNAICIPVATGAFYFSLGVKLNPMIGAAAMSLSSVCVVTNALRLKKIKFNVKEEKKNMENNKKIIYIDGMSCNHCKMSVEKALSEIDGVEKVDVILEEKKAIVTFFKELDDKNIKDIIEKIGFNVKDIK